MGPARQSVMSWMHPFCPPGGRPDPRSSHPRRQAAIGGGRPRVPARVRTKIRGLACTRLRIGRVRNSAVRQCYRQCAGRSALRMKGPMAVPISRSHRFDSSACEDGPARQAQSHRKWCDPVGHATSLLVADPGCANPYESLTRCVGIRAKGVVKIDESIFDAADNDVARTGSQCHRNHAQGESNGNFDEYVTFCRRCLREQR